VPNQFFIGLVNLRKQEDHTRTHTDIRRDNCSQSPRNL